ncbi:Glycosyltransferase, GT2 family [Polaromonas sp. OV174]|uniref:glycosyltransferase family 2 protein n=1 Tax=Polaromonas sp. OV174 TaxID=1855300 RepID=UPI0008E61823|nr:glycosyltransferase family 2 protein [Polaromonas sp. OV174]SFC37801.1 Glycosyltransferase, GT2 family [Polaromonas sp. OV174]
MKISFIVLTYNRTDALLAVLRSLSQQCDERHEVLIADDGSRADQVQMLFERCPVFKCPVRHIWHPDVGFTAAQARNLAASLASGDYLVFLDGDCVPGKNFVAQHSGLAETGCFVNGSRVLLSERLTTQVLDGTIDLPTRPVSFWLGARLRGDCNKLLHLLTWPWRLFRVKQGFQWHGIRSCNFAVWQLDFFKVNGFDETFQGWGHEDADLVLRLSHLGVLRKNGFMATEVFHLWHREHKRDQESVNKSKVLQRMETDLILADKGLREIDPGSPVKLTQLH